MAKDTAQTSTAQARSASPFLNIPAEIAQHPGLSHSARLVYGALNRLHKINTKRGKNAFQVSQERLAQQIGRSVRTVKRTLYELRGKPDAAGVPQFEPLVVVIGSGRCNWYRVLPLESEKAPEKTPLLAPGSPNGPLPTPEPLQAFEPPCADTKPQERHTDDAPVLEGTTGAPVAPPEPPDTQATDVDNLQAGYQNQRYERPKVAPSREGKETARALAQLVREALAPHAHPSRPATP